MSTKKNIDGEDVLPGYRGNLDASQQASLREMWRRFFELSEKNKHVSEELDRKGGPKFASKDKSAAPPANEKDAGKNIPKGDAAKEEAKKMEEMKEMNSFLEKYGGPYLLRACWEFNKHDNPDSSMLRFLRARKWDVDRALAMLAAALKFRFEKDIEGIIHKGEDGLKDVPGFLNQFRRGISYIKGNSDVGEYPIYFIHVGRHFTNAQKHEVLQQFVLLAMENARLLTTPPYEKAVIIFDMTGFGLKNMDWQCVLFLVQCLEAYYPESLQRIYVHGAPWIFKGIWSILQPMLDPVVRDKIKFSSKAPELVDHIPPTKLRKGMGGTMDWDWEYIEPKPDENDLLKDTETRDAIQAEMKAITDDYTETTRKWIEAGDTDDTAPELTHKRDVLGKQMRLKQFQLNPYIRAVTCYQRAGIHHEDGTIHWDYPQLDGPTKTQTVGDRHSIPELIKWLRENNEDTLEDSVGGRLGACGSERSTAVGGNRNKAGGSNSKAGKGAAAAGAGAAAAASKSKSQPQEQPQPVEAEKAAAPPAEEAPRSQPTNGQANGSSQANGAENGEPQSYTGAIYGAVAGGAAAAAGTAVAAASYVTGQKNEDENSRADEHDDEEDNYAQAEDIDDYDEDDAGSNASSDSITPETAVLPSHIGKKAPTAAECKIDDNDCREDLAVVREAMSLFLNSRMKEAEELCMKGADHRLYKAEGMALINSVKSMLTFEPADFETAILCCKHSMAVASTLRKKKGAVSKLMGGSKQSNLKGMTLVQQHAELVFAESQLLKSVLGIFYAGDSIAFLKQAFSLRSAYFLMRELFQFVEYCDGEAEEAQISGRKATTTVDQDFRSGVYVGNGLCSLVLSLLPAKMLQALQGFGFTGDRKFSLEVFARAGGWTKHRPLPSISADEEGVRRPLCDIAILTYHLVISAYVPVTGIDFEFADKILSWNLVRFPNGIFFLYYSARLYAAQALPEKAIEYYRNAIESQKEYKQLHHLCFWDLSLTYLCTCDFARAYECYDVLSRESNWSKAIYQYAKAVMLYETGMDDRAKSATIMRTVSKLVKKVAGRQIPFERFAMLKAKKYIAQGNRLPLPALEFSYLWHCIGQTPVFLLVENTLTRIDEFIDELESYVDPKSYGTGENEYWSAYCLAFFLRGVALRFLAHPEPHTLVRLPADDAIGPVEEIQQDAIQSFKKVFEHGAKLDEVDRYLVYFAHYELGRLRGCMGQQDAAKAEFKLVMSGKPLEAKGKGGIGGNSKASYILSNMCQVRAHAALETMRIQTSRSRGSFFSDAGSIAGGSSIGRSVSTRDSVTSSIRSTPSRNTTVSTRSGRSDSRSTDYSGK